MNEFTASNGIPVQIYFDGHGPILQVKNTDGTYPAAIAAGDHIDALREFFRAEEDDRLGRWRWPENPDLYVHAYSRDEGVVVHERTTETYSYDRSAIEGLRSVDTASDFARAARAYFDAHPEPKPWHDAKCGDYWYLEPFDIVYSCVGNEGTKDGLWFTRANVYGVVENVPLTDPRITRGRKVWPEATS